MTDSIEIRPTGPVRGSIRPPGSKSITNRALVCAALAGGQSTLAGSLDSEDTRVMIEALRKLGLAIDHDPGAATVRVSGCGGRIPAAGAELYAANSGTTMRFLTAMVALGEGTFRIDGSPRMRQRPIQDLLDVLGRLGVVAVSERGDGCPPVRVSGCGLPGGRAGIAGDVSSQFLSALLMAAPLASSPVMIDLTGPLVSEPYVKMTLGVMSAFGVSVLAGEGFSSFEIRPQQYAARRYAIEPDASAASYFFAAAAITGGQVTVEGLSRDSIQGDVAFCDCLGRMGCRIKYGRNSITVSGGKLRGIEVDMNAISDTVQTLAAVALFADGPTLIRGVGHIRHKETDRLGALGAELPKLGAEVDERPDGLQIVPGRLRGAEIDTYDDHRMAMSLALAGLGMPEGETVVIRDPGCTAKTYPGFFSDLAGLSS